MRDTMPATHTSKAQRIMSIGQSSHISVDSFKIILEMFSEAIIHVDNTHAWAPGDAQLVNAKHIIVRFYDYQDSNIPAIAIEMFNDRLIGNLRNNELGQLTHSQYQPKPLVEYAAEVVDWGLVAGLVSIPDDVTFH